MINFKFNGEEYSLRNTPEELTISEFEQISSIINNEELDYIDKFMTIFKHIGLDEELIEELDGKTFIQLTKDFMNYQYTAELINEVEIDGYTYVASDRHIDGEKITYVPRIKDLKLIEKYIKQNQNKYAAKVMAVIFKRNDLTKTEHYDDAHIKHKAELFSNQPYSVILPYIGVVLEQITTNIKNKAENESEQSIS